MLLVKEHLAKIVGGKRKPRTDEDIRYNMAEKCRAMKHYKAEGVGVGVDEEE